MDDAALLKDLRGLGKPPLFGNDTAKTANSEVQESIKGLDDKHSKFEIEQGNVTDTPKCAISTIDHGEQIDHRNTGKGKSKHTGKRERQIRRRCGNESPF